MPTLNKREIDDAFLNKREIDDAFYKYMPLAVTVAKRYKGKLPPDKVEEQDLIQEALFGLYRCLLRYDPACSPLTYWVTSHIKGAIQDYLRKCDLFPQEVRAEIKRLKAAEEALKKKLLREPTDQLADHLNRLEAAEEALRQGLMREPTDRELADHLEVSDPKVDKRWSETKVNERKQWLEIWNLIYLDDATLPPPLMPTVPGDAEMATALDQYWENLKPREKVAVKLHVYDGACLEKIASVLKVSRATAGRILDTALRKLAEALALEDHDGE